MPGISSYHFALQFDDHHRPIVKDLGSLSGTEVLYGQQGAGKRRNFVWIIGGKPGPETQHPIVINIHQHLKFQIVVSSHNSTSQPYIDSVNRFRQGTTNTKDLLGRLDLQSRPQTERPSGAYTPGTGPIVMSKKLGEGAFGVVTRLWNVSTGDERALKQPSRKAIREGRLNVDAWKKEARIMGLISHVSRTISLSLSFAVRF